MWVCSTRDAGTNEEPEAMTATLNATHETTADALGLIRFAGRMRGLGRFQESLDSLRGAARIYAGLGESTLLATVQGMALDLIGEARAEGRPVE
jgi:hypothetical protein